MLVRFFKHKHKHLDINHCVHFFFKDIYTATTTTTKGYLEMFLGAMFLEPSDVKNLGTDDSLKKYFF